MTQQSVWTDAMMPPEPTVGLSSLADVYDDEEFVVSDEESEILEQQQMEEGVMESSSTGGHPSFAAYHDDLGDYDKLMEQAEMGEASSENGVSVAPATSEFSDDRTHINLRRTLNEPYSSEQVQIQNTEPQTLGMRQNRREKEDTRYIYESNNMKHSDANLYGNPASTSKNINMIQEDIYNPLKDNGTNSKHSNESETFSDQFYDNTQPTNFSHLDISSHAHQSNLMGGTQETNQLQMDDVITLSSDDEEEKAALATFKQPPRVAVPKQSRRPNMAQYNRAQSHPVYSQQSHPVYNQSQHFQSQYPGAIVFPKRKGRRRKGTIFYPIRCGNCGKPKRDIVCLAKHLINHHWEEMRQYQAPGGGKGSTDYFNLPDDREIKPDKDVDERRKLHRAEMYEEASMGRQAYDMPMENLPGGKDKSGIWHNPRFGEGSIPKGMMNEASISDINEQLRYSESGSVVPKDSQLMDQVEEEKARRSRNEEGTARDPRVIQQRLGLILHAHKCQNRNTKRRQNSLLPPEEKDCNVEGCASTQSVLLHLPSCQAGEACTQPGCPDTRQVIQWALSGDSPIQSSTLRSELHKQAKMGLPKQVVQYMTSQNEREKWGSWRKNKMPRGNVGPTQTLPPSLPIPQAAQNRSSVILPSPNTHSMKGNQALGNRQVPRGLPRLLPKGVRVPPSGPALGPSPHAPGQGFGGQGSAMGEDPSRNSAIAKYNEALEKRKKRMGGMVEAASVARLGQVRTVKEKPEESTSKAPVDFLSGLLNNQESSFQDRTIKKPKPIIDKRYGNISITKVSNSGSKEAVRKNFPGVKQVKPPVLQTNRGADAAAYNSMLDL